MGCIFWFTPKLCSFTLARRRPANARSSLSSSQLQSLVEAAAVRARHNTQVLVDVVVVVGGDGVAIVEDAVGHAHVLSWRVGGL